MVFLHRRTMAVLVLLVWGGCETSRPSQESSGRAGIQKLGPEAASLRPDGFGIRVEVPPCVAPEPTSGGMSLPIRVHAKLRTDCASVEERRHPEYGIEPWVFVRVEGENALRSNALHADSGAVTPPRVRCPNHPIVHRGRG